MGDGQSSSSVRTQGLRSGYGESEVLHGIDFEAPSQQVTAILGRNGAGKTTLVNTIIGLIPLKGGRIFVGDEDLSEDPAWKRARCGMQLVRQGRHIFPSLTAQQNPELLATGEEPLKLDRFPTLADRLGVLGRNLSGGEQQMLAIARALQASPSILMLDEPCEGLAPHIVAALAELIRDLEGTGHSIVLVEENVPFALQLATLVYVIGQGRIAFSGTPAELRSRPDIQHKYLGV